MIESNFFINLHYRALKIKVKKTGGLSLILHIETILKSNLKI
jgi:hypothetical protein